MNGAKKRKAKVTKKTLVVVGKFNNDVMFVISESIYKERCTIGMPGDSANFAAIRLLTDRVIALLSAKETSVDTADLRVLVLEEGHILVVTQGNGVGLLSPEEYAQAAEGLQPSASLWGRFNFSEIAIG